MNPSIADWLTLGVLTLTLVAVGWYAFVTHRLHQVAQQQLAEVARTRRLSVMPALLPEVRPAPNIIDAFQLTNVGNGVALNVVIDDVKIAPDTLPNSYYRFQSIPMLRPGESASAPYNDFLEGVRLDKPHGLPHFKPEFATSTLTLRFTFRDIEGSEYEQLSQMGKGGNRHISVKLMNDS